VKRSTPLGKTGYTAQCDTEELDCKLDETVETARQKIRKRT
jgi:hypothetical protein